MNIECDVAQRREVDVLNCTIAEMGLGLRPLVTVYEVCRSSISKDFFRLAMLNASKTSLVICVAHTLDAGVNQDAPLVHVLDLLSEHHISAVPVLTRDGACTRGSNRVSTRY